jgi:hypothetical protein
MKRWKKITLWSIASITLLVIGLVIYSFSDVGVFRGCVMSPIPPSVRDLRSAQTGLGQDWSASFYFHASPDDTAKILRAVGFGSPADMSDHKSNFVAQWQNVYTDMGCPSPSSRPSAIFYYRTHQQGVDYALVSPDTQEVFLTRWEVY